MNASTKTPLEQSEGVFDIRHFRTVHSWRCCANMSESNLIVTNGLGNTDFISFVLMQEISTKSSPCGIYKALHFTKWGAFWLCAKPQGLKYLGFGFCFDSRAHQFKAKPHAKAVAKFKKRMQEITCRLNRRVPNGTLGGVRVGISLN